MMDIDTGLWLRNCWVKMSFIINFDLFVVGAIWPNPNVVPITEEKYILFSDIFKPSSVNVGL